MEKPTSAGQHDARPSAVNPESPEKVWFADRLVGEACRFSFDGGRAPRDNSPVTQSPTRRSRRAATRVGVVLAMAVGGGACTDDRAAGDAVDSGAVDLADDGPTAGGADGGRSDAGGGCPAFASEVALGDVASVELDEASGLAVSRTNADVLWTHNDSGDTARLFALGRDGAHLGLFNLVGAEAIDYEDLALGPGPEPGASYLYVGDIGDNAERRATISVYRVEEPVVEAARAPTVVDLSGVERLVLRYPDGPHNAETLLVDPRLGDLFIVTKRDDGDSRVFRSQAPHDARAPRTLELVASLSFGPGGLAARSALTTAGDISADGSQIVIRTYWDAFLWTRGEAQTVAEALGQEPCVLPLAFEPQGEAIAFDPLRGGYYTLSERVGQPLYYWAPR